jgi:flagellin-like protein
MHQSMSSRKGASEVIAALLLILITVAAAILLYGYASGLMGGLLGGAVQQPYLEQVALDYYNWATLSTLQLTIRNVGVTKLNIVAAEYFINGQLIASPTIACGTFTASTLIPQGSCLVTLNSPSGLSSGFAYNVKIATREGAIFSYSCIAGQAA